MMQHTKTMYRIYAYDKDEYEEVERKNAQSSCKILLTSKTIEYFGELPAKEEIERIVKGFGCNLYFVDEIVTVTTRETFVIDL
jgi:hypothetical protein